jgi:hypothetical protein
MPNDVYREGKRVAFGKFDGVDSYSIGVSEANR